MGKFQGSDDLEQELKSLKKKFNIEELFFLHTCNRIELIVYAGNNFAKNKAAAFFKHIAAHHNHVLAEEKIEDLLEWYEGILAVEHIFRVSSSLDSMVVGEREIITQFRKAYELNRKEGLSGDFLRVLAQSTIETAKQVFTETKVARHPVSVTSLAYKEFKKKVEPSANILMIGAGQVNAAMHNFLTKDGYQNISIYNRSIQKAKELAGSSENAFALKDIGNHKLPVDAIVTCTGANDPIITLQLIEKLKANSLKCIVDLAVPTDTEDAVREMNAIQFIGVEDLKRASEKNLRQREKEIVHCEEIIRERIKAYQIKFRERQVEKAFSEIPNEVKKVKEKAIEQVFAKELDKADAVTRQLVEKMMDYMEKKCVGIPIKVAKKNWAKA